MAMVNMEVKPEDSHIVEHRYEIVIIVDFAARRVLA